MRGGWLLSGQEKKVIKEVKLNRHRLWWWWRTPPLRLPLKEVPLQNKPTPRLYYPQLDESHCKLVGTRKVEEIDRIVILWWLLEGTVVYPSFLICSLISVVAVLHVQPLTDGMKIIRMGVRLRGWLRTSLPVLWRELPLCCRSLDDLDLSLWAVLLRE